MNQQTEYQKVIQHLLAGKFICEITHESQYEYLNDSQNCERVNDFLITLNRKVRQTSDKKAFLCAYANIDDKAIKDKVKAQFKELCIDLEALIRWLTLAQSSQPHRDPLRSGDMLNESDILNAMISSQPLCDQLDALCRKGLFISGASTPKDKVKQIFKRLTETGYLLSIGHSGMRYQATAKWSWLYDTLDFIRSHESIEVEPQSEKLVQQPELLQ